MRAESGAEFDDHHRADYPYLLSFENDRNFLTRQSVALALLAVAGFIEFPGKHSGNGIWSIVLAATLAIMAIFIAVAALRRYRAVDEAIRASHPG